MNRATLLSRVVFGLLVAATFLAFFAAQRLKRTDALVSAVRISGVVSPNRDRIHDRARIVFRTARRDQVTVDVIDGAGVAVRTIVRRRAYRPERHLLHWDGRDDAGKPVDDGRYRVRIGLERRGRVFVSPTSIAVDTAPPAGFIRTVSPHLITPGQTATGPAHVIAYYHGGLVSRRGEFLVYPTRNAQAAPRPVASFAGSIRRPAGRWDGTVGSFMRRPKHCGGRSYSIRGHKRPAPAGTYVLAVRFCDAAGNEGSAPAKLPPTRIQMRGRPGVIVRYLEAAPPPLPLRPGALARIPVNSPQGRFSWRLRPAAAGTIVARGRATRGPLRLRVPRTRDGVYVLSLGGRRGRAQIPIVISRSSRAPLLLVLPAISWFGSNAADIDRDGFGDTLSSILSFHKPPPAPPKKKRASAINFVRPLVGGRLPADFARNVGPLSRFVATGGQRFEVTTDIALQARPGMLFDGERPRYRGVIFAGDERWFPAAAGLRVRDYVDAGGKVASFGLDSFRRTVMLDPGADLSRRGRLRQPGERDARDIFGEAAAVVRIAPAPVVPFIDQLGILAGPTGLFSQFEQSKALAHGASTLLAAGRLPASPAVIGYRLGRGRVFRIGVAGWNNNLGDPQVAGATSRLLQELAR